MDYLASHVVSATGIPQEATEFPVEVYQEPVIISYHLVVDLPPPGNFYPTHSPRSIFSIQYFLLFVYVDLIHSHYRRVINT